MENPLLKPLKDIVEYLEGEMDEADKLNHMLDCPSPEFCVLCQAKQAIQEWELSNEV